MPNTYAATQLNDDEIIDVIHNIIYPRVKKEWNENPIRPIEMTDETFIINESVFRNHDHTWGAYLHFIKNEKGFDEGLYWLDIGPNNINSQIKSAWKACKREVYSKLRTALIDYLIEISPFPVTDQNFPDTTMYPENTSGIHKKLMKSTMGFLASITGYGYSENKYAFGLLVNWLGTEDYRDTMRMRGNKFNLACLSIMKDSKKVYGIDFAKKQRTNTTLLAFSLASNHPLHTTDHTLDNYLNQLDLDLTREHYRTLERLSPRLIKAQKPLNIINFLRALEGYTDEIPTYTMCKYLMNKQVCNPNIIQWAAVESKKLLKNRKMTQKAFAGTFNARWNQANKNIALQG